MKIHELLSQELKQEVALTEKFLNRIPEDKLDWRPHDKSMEIGVLANHLADIPSWVTGTMNLDELDLADYQTPNLSSRDDLVKALHKNAEEAQEALRKEDVEFTDKNWRMLMNGEVVMDMPKLQVLRSVVLGQLPHHRAQLGVYFRLLDIPVPATYGPSADE